MNPLIDFAALRLMLPLVLLVAPVVLGLIAFNAYRFYRRDREAEEFAERCRRVDVYEWHDRKAA